MTTERTVGTFLFPYDTISHVIPENGCTGDLGVFSSLILEITRLPYPLCVYGVYMICRIIGEQETSSFRSNLEGGDTLQEYLNSFVQLPLFDMNELSTR